MDFLEHFVKLQNFCPSLIAILNQGPLQLRMNEVPLESVAFRDFLVKKMRRILLPHIRDCLVNGEIASKADAFTEKFWKPVISIQHFDHAFVGAQG